MQQREHFRPVELFAAIEELEFHHKAHAGDLRAQRFGPPANHAGQCWDWILSEVRQRAAAAA
jgi:hypothetical protein